MITCRRATNEDVAIFKEVRLRSLKDSPDSFGSTYQSNLERDDATWVTQLQSTTTGPFRNTQFAFDGDNCIGIAALYRKEDASGGDIIMMWVAPDYRGGDAASRLVQALLDWAKQAGFEFVELGVTDTNARAIRFYENCGFRSTGDTFDVDLARELRGIRMRISVS